MNKKVLFVFLITLLLLMTGAVVAQDNVAVVTWWTEDFMDIDQLNATVVEPFNAEHPNIRLEITTQVELNETLTATLVNASDDVSGSSNDVFLEGFISTAANPNNTATGTIVNDDSAVFTVNSNAGNENGGPITFTVTLSNPVDTATSVQVSTSDGTGEWSTVGVADLKERFKEAGQRLGVNIYAQREDLFNAMHRV